MDNKVIIKRINDWLEVYQNKNDGYYNASQLLRDYNEHYPNEQKLMKDFLRNKNTQNYIGCVVDEEKPKVRIITFGNNQQVTEKSRNGEKSTSLKNNELYYFKKGRALKGGGKTPDTYYFAPMLFSKFGTWLSAKLEKDIHKVLWNNVLEYRNELRRINPKLHDSIATIAGDDNNIYIKVHSMLNKAVFGRFEREGKQIDSSNENQLNMMKDIESEIIVLIKHNIITDYEQLKTHIQRYYL
jgi:hypothetical protein